MNKKTSARNMGSKYYKKQGRKNTLPSNKQVKIEKIIINILALVVLTLIFMYIKNKYFSKNNHAGVVHIENVAALKVPENTFKTLHDLSDKYKLDFSEVVAVYSLHNDFYRIKIDTPTVEVIEKDFFINYKSIRKKHKKDLKKYIHIFETIFNDIENFPIETSFNDYNYMDGWGTQRDYGGDRIHMGTDIMDKQNIRGRIKILSMTNGTIENIGWNELGGYRVGIRTDSGAYFYYAHLDSFSQGLKKDDVVKAGDHIGNMGDTGYSKVIGTRGIFPVHLHIGISLETDLTKEEFWINPYPFLKYINRL